MKIVAKAKKFVSQQQQHQQQLQLQQQATDINIGPTFKCDICFKTFSTAFTVRRHRSIHNPNFHKHTCNFCPRRFNWVDNLRAHIQSVHGIQVQSKKGEMKFAFKES